MFENSDVKAFEEALQQLRGAYSENTIRGYRSDFRLFEDWCLTANASPLPATAETVVCFIEAMVDEKLPATIRRRLAGISRVHRLLGHPSPVSDQSVKLALRRLLRSKGTRQKQVLGLTATLKERLVAVCPRDLRGLRNRTILSTGYDTLCRRSELVSLLAEDISKQADGSGSILIRRSKTDQFGAGRLGYLSPDTMALLRDWQIASGIVEGPLFRAIRGSKVQKSALDSGTVARIVKVAANRAKLSQDEVRQLSGHSMRVGAALDMVESGIDLVPVMHAGGWKTPGMVLRYTQQISLAKSGMAELHRLRSGGR